MRQKKIAKNINSRHNHEMENTKVFSSKAEKYARYRWDYSPASIQTLFDITGLSVDSVAADIGAGTGIFTRHLADRVRRVYAIEPNPQMREIAVRFLCNLPSCQVINGQAEATTIADTSVDLITVATAFNWFDPEITRAEFRRILKPGGWLAKVYNYGTNQELGKALGVIYPAETDTETIMKGKNAPLSFYMGHSDFQTFAFPFTNMQSWDAFLGAVASASYAPDESSPYYAAFECSARQVFDRFASNGLVRVDGVTEISFGQMNG